MTTILNVLIQVTNKNQKNWRRSW